jgi:hypothetical protein
MGSNPKLTEAAIAFCLWYDRYQTEYARERLKADMGRVQARPPKSLMGAYEHMIEAYEALHIAATGEPRPNYVEVAKGPIVRSV